MARAVALNLFKAAGLVALLAALFGGLGWLIGGLTPALLFAFCSLLAATAVYRYGDRALLGMRQRLPPITSHGFRLFPFRSPLLRESRFLSFPRATKMFQFARLALPCLCIQQGVRAHYHAWVSPFGNPRVKGWSAPHRGLSQPPTSFIASWRQGIRRVPLFS